jgi:hypothetical protein
MLKKVAFFFLTCFTLHISNAQLTYTNLKVAFDSAWVCNHLQLTPIRYKDKGIQENSFPKKMISLQQAMQKKKVEIKENYFEGNADVRTLLIKNNSTENVLVMDGDLLQGGKQDRMIAETKLIPPGKEVEYLNVFCIEKGRWSKKAKAFSYAGFAGNNLRKVADSTAIQQYVWMEIEKQFNQGKVASNDFPYLQIQKMNVGKDTACFSYFINKFKTSDSSFAGFIAVSDTSIIGCDVFASAMLTNASFSNLLSAYMQAANHSNQTPLKITTKKLTLFSDNLFTNDERQKAFLLHHGKASYSNKKPIHIAAYGN